jgi:DNA-binding SARP family transcriptional activator
LKGHIVEDETRVRLRLLGPIELEIAGAVVPLGGQKRIGMLAFIGLQPRHTARVAQLADAIWPGQGTEQATRTIRTYVSQLRHAGLTDLVADRTGNAYRLDIPETAIDAVAFEQLINRGLAETEAATARQHLAAALELWRASPLTEIKELDWTQPAIATLEALHRSALRGLVDARLALGEHVALAGELELLVVAHPYDEGFWRALMLALYRSGRQTEALRTYQRARRQLLDDLSLEPGPELRELEAAILRQDSSLLLASREPVTVAAVPAAAPVAAPVSDLSWVAPSALPLVGREEELALLADWLPEGFVGPRMAVLEGIPGVGKTRLLAALAERQPDDVLVLFGRAEDRATPYQLWHRLVERLLPTLPVATAPEAFATLTAIAGRAAEGSSALASAPGLPAVSISRLIEETARQRRVLLVLDDLHWADEASLNVLRWVLETSDFAGLAIVASSRPIDHGAPTLLAETLRAAERANALRTVPIHTLDRARTAALVAAIGGSAASADALFESSGGVPLLLVELLQREGAGAPATSLASEVERRLQRLGTDGADLVRVASLVGLSFDAILLGAALRMDDADVASTMDIAVTEMLIRPVPEDPGSYEFSHPVIADAVRSTISTGTALLFHRAVAVALEERRAGGQTISLDALAGHWLGAGRAGDLDQALAACRDAGDQAVRQLAYEVASHHYRSAIGLIERRGSEPEELAVLLLRLADTENAAGDVGAAKLACGRAAAAARAAGRRDLLADAAISHGGPIPMGADIEDPDSQAMLREADAGPLDAARRARVRSRLAQLEYWQTDRATRLDWVRQAAQTGRELGDPQLRAETLLAGYWALNCPDLASERLEILSRLDAAVLELGDLGVLLQAGKCHLHLQLELGDLAEAVHGAERHRRLAERLGQTEHLRLALVFDANLAIIEGRWADGRRLADAAEEMATRRGMRFHGAVVRHLQAMAMDAAGGGTVADEQRWWDRLAAAEPRRPLWRAMAAWVASRAGDTALANGHLQALDLSGFIAAEKRVDWWPVLAAAANTAVALSDVVLAGQLYDALLPFSSFNMVTGQTAFWGAATWHLGRLARLRGDVEAASEHLGDAERRHQRMGATPFLSTS